MARLGDVLGGNMRDDFMVVHFQEPCMFCRGHVHGATLHRYVPAASAAAPSLRAGGVGGGLGLGGLGGASGATAVGGVGGASAALASGGAAAGASGAAAGAAGVASGAGGAGGAAGAAASGALAAAVGGASAPGGAGAGGTGGLGGGLGLGGPSALGLPAGGGVGAGGGGPPDPKNWVAGGPGPGGRLQVCDACFHDEAARVGAGRRSRLPPGVALTDLVPVDVPPLPPPPPGDDAGGIESEFFETRQAFLSLCQGNHYQFDSARRAKHSSMMVLYHLHNPSAPAFASACNVCHAEIEAGTGWRCTVCSDFDMCGGCRARGHPHPHPLVAHTDYARVDETRTRLTEGERQERAQQLQRTMALLVHACACADPDCASTSCRKVRNLFNHAVGCALKVTGGCPLCKKMWCLLNLHARSCTAGSNCPVPRCPELKELKRRTAARMDSQRRAAYQALVRTQGGD
jgi:hypothetical protein